MTTDSPEISVIIPAYNAGKFFRECLDSVIGQTYTKWELLIADDGSTDETGPIADEYAEKDSRIIVIHTDAQGVSTARNTCIDKAKGTYLAFVDADDMLVPDYLQTLADLAGSTDADIVQCSFCFLAEDGSRTPAHDGTDRCYKNNKEITDAYFKGATGEIRVSVWAKLFNREAFEDVRFKPDIKVFEDAFYVYQCSMIAKRAVSISKPLYLYRQHESSAMNSKLSEIYDGYFTVFDKQREDFKDDPAISRRITIREAENSLWLMRIMVSEGNKSKFWEIRKKTLRMTGKVILSTCPFKLKMKLVGMTLMPHIYYSMLKRRAGSADEKI